MHLLGDKHAIVLSEAPRAAIQELVVHHTKCEAIFFSVRAASLMPLYVGRLKPYRLTTQPKIIAAHGTTILVGTEHPLAKLRITGETGGTVCGTKIQSYSRQNVLMKRGRKVSVK